MTVQGKDLYTLREQERRDMLENLKVGDIVNIKQAYGNYGLCEGKVSKITPTGQITVKVENSDTSLIFRFMPSGDEIGALSGRYFCQIITPRRAKGIKINKEQNIVRGEIKSILRETTPPQNSEDVSVIMAQLDIRKEKLMKLESEERKNER